MTDSDREFAQVLNALVECRRELWCARKTKSKTDGFDYPLTHAEEAAQKTLALYRGQFAAVEGRS